MSEVYPSYPQNWPAYNCAQTQEKALFCGLLRDLAGAVPEVSKNGDAHASR